MAMTFANIAEITEQKFPFVTIPNYGLYAAKSMPLTASAITTLLPVVSFEQRMQWEAYAAGNNTHLHSWVEETLDIQDHWAGKASHWTNNYIA
jgi:hypothetical protein